MSMTILSKLVVNDDLNSLYWTSRASIAAVFGFTATFCFSVSYRFLCKLTKDSQKRLLVPFLITCGSGCVCISYIFVIYAQWTENVELYALGTKQYSIYNSLFCV